MKVPLYSRGLKIFTWLCMTLAPLVLLCTALYLLLSFNEMLFNVYAIIFLVVTTPFPFLIIKLIKSGSLNSSIEISNEGVTLLSKTKICNMKWENIRLVGLTQPVSNSIVFSAKMDHNLLKRYHKFEHLSNNLIVVQNRKGLIEEVRKYWDGPIISK